MRRESMKKINQHGIGSILLGAFLIFLSVRCAEVKKEFNDLGSSLKETYHSMENAVKGEKSKKAEKSSKPEKEQAKAQAKEQAKVEKKEPVKEPVKVTKEEKRKKPATRNAYLEHTISWPGETLSVIAKWYTGKFDNWKALVKANPDLNPKRIHIGQRILIPEYLLTNRKPMPKDFSDQFLPKKKVKRKPAEQKPTEQKPAQKEEAEPVLFGPKE